MKWLSNLLKTYAQRWMRLARCAGYLPPCKHDFVEVYEGFRCKKCSEWLPDDYFGPDAEEPYCFHCGKALEDFSDLGCGRCDARHPDFVIIGKADNAGGEREPNAGERFDCKRWLDALAEKWARRGDGHLREADEYYAHRPDQYEHFRGIGATWKAASKELRAEMESASNGGSEARH